MERIQSAVPMPATPSGDCHFAARNASFSTARCHCTNTSARIVARFSNCFGALARRTRTWFVQSANRKTWSGFCPDSQPEAADPEAAASLEGPKIWGGGPPPARAYPSNLYELRNLSVAGYAFHSLVASSIL